MRDYIPEGDPEYLATLHPGLSRGPFADYIPAVEDCLPAGVPEGASEVTGGSDDGAAVPEAETVDCPFCDATPKLGGIDVHVRKAHQEEYPVWKAGDLDSLVATEEQGSAVTPEALVQQPHDVVASDGGSGAG